MDEYHTQKNHALISMLEAKFAKRKNPIWIGISTAGIYSQERPCYQEYQLAKKIASGEIENPHFLPVIYEAAPDSDWTDEKTWIACNPALQAGFKNIKAMRKSFKLAQEIPSRESFWRQQHLNQWSNQSTQWLSKDAWDASNVPFDVDECLGRECVAGMDLAPVHDISSFCLLFRFDDGSYKVLSYNWCNEKEIDDRSKEFPYNIWERQGFLRSTPGEATDFEFIRRDINELAKLYNIKVIATDPYQCHQLAQELQEQDGLNVQWFRQGFVSQAEPTFKLERLVIDKKLHHNGNPVLRWAAGNVVTVSDDAGNIKISKKKSTEKIDPIAALVNAIGIEMIDTEEQPSVYETEGIFYV
jgi:phage terminase large subunit-like protein